jgi:hypothetical protein
LRWRPDGRRGADGAAVGRAVRWAADAAAGSPQAGAAAWSQEEAGCGGLDQAEAGCGCLDQAESGS